MEVYVLDSLLRRTEVIDRFESLIWTERYREIGEFELVVQSTSANRRRFTTGTRIAITESRFVMKVETVENATDDEGRNQLKVKGRDIGCILEDRAAIGMLGGNQLAEWSFQDTPEEVARKMFHDVCVLGAVDPKDVIPYIQWNQTSFPTDNIPESTFEILHYQKPDSLYNAIKGLADIYDFGFRLYRNGDASQLFFNIYTGSDRTPQQNTLPPVIFSPELENVKNTTELTTIAKTKNCAYVHAIYNETLYTLTVYPPDVDPLVDGFDRRILFVNHSIDDPGGGVVLTNADIAAQMERAGQDELAKNRAFTAFDGEISQTSQYKYMQHYFLGDLVGLQNSDGFMNSMRVTEQIFVSDREGDRAYPTLSVNLTITPGSWESWGFQAWEDVEATEFWENQP